MTAEILVIHPEEPEPERIAQVVQSLAAGNVAALPTDTFYGLARDIDTAFDRLAERFWPGPLTLVVKAGTRLPLRVTANTGNVALRVPESPIARAVVAGLGLPITATSANLRGMPECTSSDRVFEQLCDQIPLIVDGGATPRSLPTTIVDLSGGGNSWMILREGAIPTHEIALTLQH